MDDDMNFEPDFIRQTEKTEMLDRDVCGNKTKEIAVYPAQDTSLDHNIIIGNHWVNRKGGTSVINLPEVANNKSRIQENRSDVDSHGCFEQRIVPCDGSYHCKRIRLDEECGEKLDRMFSASERCTNVVDVGCRLVDEIVVQINKKIDKGERVICGFTVPRCSQQVTSVGDEAYMCVTEVEPDTGGAGDTTGTGDTPYTCVAGEVKPNTSDEVDIPYTCDAGDTPGKVDSGDTPRTSVAPNTGGPGDKPNTGDAIDTPYTDDAPNTGDAGDISCTGVDSCTPYTGNTSDKPYTGDAGDTPCAGDTPYTCYTRANRYPSRSLWHKVRIPLSPKSPYKNTHRERPFKCDICGVGCSQISGLRAHVRTHTGEKPYKCDVCEGEFVKLSHLKGHARTHTGERPYKCDVCGIGFAEGSSLKSHKRTHTGEKPYKCDICGVGFAQNSNLKSHKRTHTGERPYTCDVCGADFTKCSHLNTHKRTHTGERPYKCDVCGVGFSQSGHLKRHRRTHTGERPYKCDVCGDKFIRNGHLTTHLRIHNGEKT